MFRHLRVVASVVLLATVLTPLAAAAQGEGREGPWSVAKRVLIDPTTYAPAAIAYEAKMQDWRTSQVFFEHGWLERNVKYTISGRPNDVPLSYASGKRVIRHEALVILQWSLANNAAAVIGEDLLIARFPNRRKLIRGLGWVERISVASYLAYVKSAGHFRQASRNRELARNLGY